MCGTHLSVFLFLYHSLSFTGGLREEVMRPRGGLPPLLQVRIQPWP